MELNNDRLLRLRYFFTCSGTPFYPIRSSLVQLPVCDRATVLCGNRRPLQPHRLANLRLFHSSGRRTFLFVLSYNQRTQIIWLFAIVCLWYSTTDDLNPSQQRLEICSVPHKFAVNVYIKLVFTSYVLTRLVLFSFFELAVFLCLL